MKFSILGIKPPKGQRWKIGQKEIEKLIDKKRIAIIDGKIKLVIYPQDEESAILKPFWSHLEDVGTAEDGKKQLNELFSQPIGFDTVKSIGLLKELIYAATNPNDLILDFFAGSGTTAHAVMQLNAEDGGNRQFICVQLPEPTDPKSEAHKAGFATISDITKERIRRAAAKLQQEYGDNVCDLGFKAFCQCPSNFKAWQPPTSQASHALKATLQFFASTQKDHASTDGVLYELLLTQGMPLNSDIVLKNGVHYATCMQKNGFGDDESYCIALFLTTIDLDKIQEAIRHGVQKVVVLEDIFADINQKQNVFLTLNHHNILFETR